MAKTSRLPPMAPSKDPAAYPLFTGAVSRFAWQVYTQRLTPAGRWFAAITLLFTAYGGASLQLQGYVVAVYLGAAWAVAIAAAIAYRPRVKFTAAFSPRVCAGQTVDVDVDVEQSGRFGGADLVVLPHRLPPDVDAVPEGGVSLPDLRRGQRARARVGLHCPRRGTYALRGFRVETDFPFGILRARRTFREEHALLVYPRFTPLGRLALPTGRRYQPGGVALTSALGESFEYLGNREYREGDNLRDIDWRATARVGRPIVREWVEEYMLRCAVMLDTQVPAGLGRRAAEERDGAFERAVSVAASVSDYMARQDYLVDLFAAGPTLHHLTAGRGLAFLDQILDILACVEAKPDEPFTAVEPQIGELLDRLSTLICVFLDWDEARRSFALRQHAQGLAVKAIVLHDGPCTLDPKVDAPALGDVPVISAADYERGLGEL